MKKIYILLLCTAHILAEAQSANETTTEYFDNNWKTTLDPESASYYRTLESTDTNFIVRDYFISGKIQMIVYCSSVSPKMFKEGKSILYYENGVVHEESIFKNDNRIGVYKSFYPTGKPKSEEFYGDKQRYIHYYSERGEDLLHYGKGLIMEEAKEMIRYIEIEDSLVFASFYIDDGIDTIYSRAEKQAVYRGGFERMMKDLASVITYPKNARRNGIKGTVYVQFIVDKKGRVEDCRILKGLNPECDEEASQGVAKLLGWSPGIYRSKPVNSSFVIPVTFKL